MIRRVFLLASLVSGSVFWAQEGEQGTYNSKENKKVRKNYFAHRVLVEDTLLSKNTAPHFSQEEIDKKRSVPKNTVLWNTDQNCIEIFDGFHWLNQCGGRKLLTPKGVKFGSSQIVFSSIYDDDYLPYVEPKQKANWGKQKADGKADPLIDFQGKIPQKGINIMIPIQVEVGTPEGVIKSFSTWVNIPDEKTENRAGQKLFLSWEAQSFNEKTKFIQAKIKPEKADLYIKKLDINAGVGNDYKGVELALFRYGMNTYRVGVVSGIPDRNFQVEKSKQTMYSYGFVYVPVQAMDGKIWLNNNLGADYNNVFSKSFSPAQQAKSYADFRAFGSLFQWQRKADGHELIGWRNSNTGSPFYTSTDVLSSDKEWVASDSRFITNQVNQYSWVDNKVNTTPVAQKDLLWGKNGPNNPCPVGFHVPDYVEFETLWISTKGERWEDTVLKLPAAGYRNRIDGSVVSPSLSGNYWSSSVTRDKGSTDSWGLFFDKKNTGSQKGSIRGYGFSVRCIKDNS